MPDTRTLRKRNGLRATQAPRISEASMTDTRTPALLPCPFCDDRDPRLFVDSFGFAMVKCGNQFGTDSLHLRCEAQTSLQNNAHDATAIWNRRPNAR